MIFDPTDFDDPLVPTTNWLHRMLREASSRRRARSTPLSHLSPRLLEDIGLYRDHAEMERRSPR